MSTSTLRPDPPTSTLPAPQPTRPVAGRSVTDPDPEFHWIAVPEAASYRLQVAASKSFDTIYYDETVEGATTIALEEVLPETEDTVVWRVRAEEEGAPWSVAATFEVTAPDVDAAGQFLVDAPPVPIRPIAGDVVQADGATLTWEGVPEASGYRVQVATDEGFDAPEVDLTLDEVTSVTFFDSLPDEEKPVHWRVRALFPNDTEGPWSETVQFETDPEGGTADVEPDQPEETEHEASIRRSAVAGGPAREAQTSSAMAFGFIAILIVSFLLTILAILMVQ